jgi:hypothetical protein
MKKAKLTTRRILFLTGVITLLTATGCIIPEGGDRHEHEREEVHPEVRVVTPEVVVRPPEVIVH